MFHCQQQQQPESINHLLFQCPKTHGLWLQFYTRHLQIACSHTWAFDQSKAGNEGWAIVWCTWKSRNDLVLNNNRISARMIFCRRCSLWVGHGWDKRGLLPNFTYSFHQWALNVDACLRAAAWHILWTHRNLPGGCVCTVIPYQNFCGLVLMFELIGNCKRLF